MDPNRILHRTLLAVVTATMVIALVPPGEAQGGASFPPQFSIDESTLSPQAPIKPDIGTAQITLEWTYTFNQLGTELSAVSTASALLTWDPPTCDRPGVVITGPLTKTVIIRENNQPVNPVRDSSTFTVEVTQDAPGETSIQCTFRGRVGQVIGTTVPATEDSLIVVPVKADFLGLISANIPTTIKQAGPQKQIRYDIEVTNLGNARSNIVFNLPEGSSDGGWNPVPPTQITLESSAQGGQTTSTTVGFLVSTPFKNGWNNKETTFSLGIQPVSTKDPESTGQEVKVNVLARVRGVYVPTLEPLVLLGAVIGSALVARRLKE